MSETFGQELRRLRTAARLSQTALAKRANMTQGNLSRIELGQQNPDPSTVTVLGDLLGNSGHLRRLAGISEPSSETDALELAQRIAASDVGGDTLAHLEAAFDDLATEYCAVAPAELLPRVAGRLDDVRTLLDAPRKTLDEHRRLLVVGGWLSLLAATVHIDLNQHSQATAWLRTSSNFARQTGHGETLAWCYETEAWRVLNTGDLKRALRLATASREHAPAGGSAEIQATVQLARVHARLGNSADTYRELDKAHVLSARKGQPELSEHHYHFDPAKTESFTATTLAWLGDEEAERYTRRAVELFAPADDGMPNPRARRYAAAQIDLALVTAKMGRLDEACASAQTAIDTGQVAPSNYWRIGEVARTAAAGKLPEAAALRASYQTLLHT